MNTTIETTADGLYYLESKIQKMILKGNKLGFPISYNVVSERMVCPPEGRAYKMFTIEVSGQEPVINGYEFVVAIEHTENGNILRGSREEVSQYQKLQQRCDHCGHHRNRIYTYVLRNVETGEDIVVGKSCLKDFIGHGDPVALAEMVAGFFELLYDVEEGDYEEGSPRHMEYIDVATFLLYSSVSDRLHGFRPSSTWDGPTSKMILTHHFYPVKKEDVLEEDATEADYEAMAGCLGWLETVRYCDDYVSDYMNNILVMVAGEWLEPKNFGFMASVLNSYRRAVENSVAIVDGGEKVPSEWVGVEKRRGTFSVKFIKTFGFETQYGWMNINIFADEDGNALVWKTGTWDGNYDWDFGDNFVECQAFVKKHDLYNGEKQTLINRVKFAKENK